MHVGRDGGQIGHGGGTGAPSNTATVVGALAAVGLLVLVVVGERWLAGSAPVSDLVAIAPDAHRVDRPT